MLSETEKYQAEVSAESNRLIKQGVPPWEAAMQAGKNVQQKRKLTKRTLDAGDSAASQEVLPQSGESQIEQLPAATQRK